MLYLTIHQHKKFLSTPSARRATNYLNKSSRPLEISIHALREEGDRSASGLGHRRPISIHALREEGDGDINAEEYETQLFLSTPSARRATCTKCTDCSKTHISIHALREEGDLWNRPESTSR